MKPRTQHPLMTTGEAAHMFRVRPITICRWIAAGKLTEARTPGGHRRLRRTEVEALARRMGIEP